jgi:hypothetical protein
VVKQEAVSDKRAGEWEKGAAIAIGMAQVALDLRFLLTRNQRAHSVDRKGGCGRAAMTSASERRLARGDRHNSAASPQPLH